MSRVVHVNLDERSYDIHIGRELLLDTVPDHVRGKILLVTDSNVGPLHGDRVEALLAARGLEAHRVSVPAGEESKNLAIFGRLLEDAVSAGLERGSAVVALGGGMVGDLAGFVAASLFRGVTLIQIPTSLLAMVDSSVGGKTAINLPQGKNLVGAFYQPAQVLADLDTLQTLPQREYVSGLGEVVKYGVIWDGALFRNLEESVDLLLGRDADFLGHVVARCCEIKAEVVAVDERESGMRAILNFGHTLAHALEQTAGYGAWLHGEAVAVGMAYAAELSVVTKELSREECDRICALLAALTLPVRPGDRGPAPQWSQIRNAMTADKKTSRGIPRFVLAERMGLVAFGCEVAEEVLERVYQAVVGKK